MPKIRILTSIAGPRFAWQEGDEVDTTELEATRLIRAGIALPVHALPIETAIAVAPERAVTRARRPRLRA